MVVVAREDIESELDDAIASVLYACQGVAIDAGLGEEARHVRLGQTEAQGVALAERAIQIGDGLYVVVYQQVVDAVHRDEGAQRVVVVDLLIGLRHGELLLMAGGPYVGMRLVGGRANLDGVTEDVRLVDCQVETVHTVASVDARHDEVVLARVMERVNHRGVGRAVRPGVRP